MKIEIWSDVMCPFCYIGKRNFEKALAQFPDSDKLSIISVILHNCSSFPLIKYYTQQALISFSGFIP
jgi:protein disulfide-isomerase